MRSLLAFLLVTLAAVPAPAQNWVRSWAAAPLEMPPPKPDAAPLHDVTIRQTVRVSAGGTAIRLRLSNELSATPLAIGAVHIALAGPDASIVSGSDRVVTFDGDAATTVPAFAPLLSDPIKLTVPALARVTVSIYLPGDASGATVHQLGVSTNRIAPGDQTAAATLTGARSSTMRYALTGIDVPGAATIVAIGDSITDGAKSTVDADRRWPDYLAERLAKAGRRGIAVANQGISANRLLKEGRGAGPALLARIDRDVLAVPGVRYVVLLEGINDIGGAMRDKTELPSADDIIDAYRQLIARAHDRGVKVILATILPYKGAFYYTPAGDAVRQDVNRWIKTARVADGVVDFDAATRDPADPLKMAAANDSGDFLHPGDAGYRVMAAAVDLRLFR